VNFEYFLKILKQSELAVLLLETVVRNCV